MKKIVKIIGIGLLLFMVIASALPFAFKGKIIDLVKQTANNNIEATLDFENADLSLLSAFPNIKLELNDFYIVNSAPFLGDTLVKAAKIDLELPFKSLFNDASKTVKVTRFSIDKALVQIKIDSFGNANYDIARKDGENPDSSQPKSDSFTFDLNDYSIKNSTVTYNDLSTDASFEFTDINHRGNGNLSADSTVLKTNTEALISFKYDSINYLKENRLALDADLKLDFKDNKYTFLENSAMINELPLVFDGFVKVNENEQQLAINFKTPSSDFKNFLALIPKEYSKNIKDVSTTGNFDIEGSVEGIINETHIPKFSISINSNDASFKYPDLAKSAKNIHINSSIVNETGLSKDTFIDIHRLAFQIDGDSFNANARLKDLSDNLKVNARIKGVLNLSNLEQVYPAEGLKGLQGILNADIITAFDMHSIEKKRYENTKTSGQASIRNFEYHSEELKNPFKIDKTALDFSPSTIRLSTFDAKIGKTDIKLNGTLKNLLGFLFSDQNLEGNFNMTSTQFVVDDFMSTTAETDEQGTEKLVEEQLKIPSFLAATINTKATTVIYDNITLTNVSGILKIKDQTASLNTMKSEVFGGQLGFDGLVTTKTSTPKFSMKLDVKNFDVSESFASLELFKSLAPIATVLKGKINTNVTLAGDLKDNFLPDLYSLTGDVFAQLFSSEVEASKAPLLQKLTNNLSFFDGKRLNLDNLKASLTFKDGKVAIKPFTLWYDDVEIAVGGNHGFDKTIDYDAVFNVPAKYLGKEAEKLLAQLSPEEQNTIKVPITAILEGNFSNPSVSTDLKSAITALTKQLASNQKDKLLSQGKEQLNDALDRLLNKGKDSISVDSTKIKSNAAVKETAKDLIKGIFGKKKKDSSKKDTID